MIFWQKISPSYIPPSIVSMGGVRLHREKILQTILIIFCLLGLPSVLLGTIGTIQDKKALLSILYLSIYALFLVLTAERRLPYSLRASIVTGSAYLLALSELAESGQLGDVRMFLISFAALTAVFFHYRVVIASVALGLLTIVGVGLASSLSSSPLSGALGNINQGTDWITSSVVFLMIASMLSGAISMIIANLDANLAHADRLAQNLEKERNQLDLRIQQRTQDIAHRMVQLQTGAEIARAISAITDRGELIQQVTEIVRERFRLYFVGVFLLDDEEQYAVLHAGTGQAGAQMVAEGHRLAVGGSSMIGWAVANRKARIALDAGSEAFRLNYPLLPLTRSEIALPIIAHETIHGAITVQSDQPDAFDDNDITVLASIADSLAIALENAYLFQEARESLDEIRSLNRQYIQQAWGDEAVKEYGGLAVSPENARFFENSVRRAEREKQVLQITARIRATNDPAEMMQIAVSELQQALSATRTQIYIRQTDKDLDTVVPENGNPKKREEGGL